MSGVCKQERSLAGRAELVGVRSTQRFGAGPGGAMMKWWVVALVVAAALVVLSLMVTGRVRVLSEAAHARVMEARAEETRAAANEMTAAMIGGWNQTLAGQEADLAASQARVAALEQELERQRQESQRLAAEDAAQGVVSLQLMLPGVDQDAYDELQAQQARTEAALQAEKARLNRTLMSLYNAQTLFEAYNRAVISRNDDEKEMLVEFAKYLLTLFESHSPNDVVTNNDVVAAAHFNDRETPVHGNVSLGYLKQMTRFAR